MYFLWYLLIGLAAGWIANLIVKGGGSGLFVNLIVTPQDPLNERMHEKGGRMTAFSC